MDAVSRIEKILYLSYGKVVRDETSIFGQSSSCVFWRIYLDNSVTAEVGRYS